MRGGACSQWGKGTGGGGGVDTGNALGGWGYEGWAAHGVQAPLSDCCVGAQCRCYVLRSVAAFNNCLTAAFNNCLTAVWARSAGAMCLSLGRCL